MSEWIDVRITSTNASKKPETKKTPQDLSASIRQANVEYLSNLAKLNASKQCNAEKCNASAGEEVYKELISWSNDMPDEEAKALLQKIHDLKNNDPRGYREFLDLMENVKANSSKDCEGSECKDEDDSVDLMKDAEEWEAGGYKEPVTKSKKKELNSSENAEQKDNAEQKEDTPAENNETADSAYTADEVEQALNSDADADPTVKLHLTVLQHGPDGPDSVDWEDPENEEFLGCIDEIASSYGIQSNYTIDGDDITIELVGDDDVATTAANDIQDQFNQSGFILMDDWGNGNNDSDDDINFWGDDWENRELTEDDMLADDDDDDPPFDPALFDDIDTDAWDPHEFS